MDSRETVLSNTLDPLVPTHDPSTNRNRVMVMIPFLLVHEMLLNMVSKRVNRLGQLAELLPDSPLFNLRKAFCVKNPFGLDENDRHRIPRRRRASFEKG